MHIGQFDLASSLRFSFQLVLNCIKLTKLLYKAEMVYAIPSTHGAEADRSLS